MPRFKGFRVEDRPYGLGTNILRGFFLLGLVLTIPVSLVIARQEPVLAVLLGCLGFLTFILVPLRIWPFDAEICLYDDRIEVCRTSSHRKTREIRLDSLCRVERDFSRYGAYLVLMLDGGKSVILQGPEESSMEIWRLLTSIEATGRYRFSYDVEGEVDVAGPAKIIVLMATVMLGILVYLLARAFF